MRISIEEALKLYDENYFSGNNTQRGNKKVRDDEFIILTHKLITCGLSNKELLAYALIHNICSNTENHKFYGSCNYVATRINSSIPYACTIIGNLVEKGYIVDTEEVTEDGVHVYSIPEEVIQVETKKKEVKNNYTEEVKEIIDYLNLQAKTKYRYGEGNAKPIRARLNEGYTVDEFKQVINNKVFEWQNTDMSKYLTPETLFGTKFDKYLNQKIKKQTVDGIIKTPQAVTQTTNTNRRVL